MVFWQMSARFGESRDEPKRETASILPVSPPPALDCEEQSRAFFCYERVDEKTGRCFSNGRMGAADSAFFKAAAFAGA
jgi:hypothetical protein